MARNRSDAAIAPRGPCRVACSAQRTPFALAPGDGLAGFGVDVAVLAGARIDLVPGPPRWPGIGLVLVAVVGVIPDFAPDLAACAPPAMPATAPCERRLRHRLVLVDQGVQIIFGLAKLEQGFLLAVRVAVHGGAIEAHDIVPRPLVLPDDPAGARGEGDADGIAVYLDVLARYEMMKEGHLLFALPFSGR